LGRTPQLQIEGLRGQRHAPGAAGVVGVLHPDAQPSRRKPALPEPPSQGHCEPTQQGMQHPEIVGIGRESMRQAILRFDLRRQHRPGIDAPGLRAEQPAPPAEDRAEFAFADSRNLADSLELILVEPEPDIVGNVGQHAQVARREEGLLVAAGNPERRLAERGLAHPFDPAHAGGRLGDQLVHRDAHGQRQPQPLPGLAPDPLGDVDGRSEEPLGAAEVEKGVPVAARLDHRGVFPEDVAERAGGAGVEPRVRRQQHQVGTQLPRPPHQHPSLHPRRLRLRGEREHRGAIGARRRYGNGPACERRRHQSLDRRTERRRVDEQHRSRQPQRTTRQLETDICPFGICSGKVAPLSVPSRRFSLKHLGM
jgi:hypothetical protein